MASSYDAFVVVCAPKGDPQIAAEEAALVIMETEGGENLGTRTFCPNFTKQVAKQAEKDNPGIVTRKNLTNAYLELVVRKEHESYQELHGKLPAGWTNVTLTEAEGAEALLKLSSLCTRAQKIGHKKWGSLKEIYKKIKA